MRKILISIVSDQTIPNVLFIREFAEFDQYVLITTTEMEGKNKCHSIITASHIPTDKCLKITVEEDNLENIEFELKKYLNLQNDDKIVVNLTCGTKIMSIGVYNYFKERGAEIYYRPIKKRYYKKIYPIEKNNIDLKFRINLNDYLIANGIEYHKEPTKKISNYCCAELMYNLFLEHKIDINIIEKLRSVRNKAKNNTKILISKTELDLFCISKDITPFGDEEIEEIKKLLSALKFDTFMNFYTIKYLTGGWFEEYVYHIIKSRIKLNDDAIDQDFIIKREGAQNEIDVAFIKDNVLYVVECKTLLELGDRNLLTESLYKLAAIKKDFGLDVRSYFFTLDERIRDLKKNIIIEHYQKRANILGIKIIDRNIIQNEEELNKEFISTIIN